MPLRIGVQCGRPSSSSDDESSSSVSPISSRVRPGRCSMSRERPRLCARSGSLSVPPGRRGGSRQIESSVVEARIECAHLHAHSFSSSYPPSDLSPPRGTPRHPTQAAQRRSLRRSRAPSSSARAGRPQCSVSQSVSYFTVPPRAHPSACPIILDRSGDVSARAHTCVASPALNPALRRAPVLTQVLGPRLFHGPAPRSHLRRLSVRLRRSRSNTSTAYRVLAPTGLLNYRK